MIVGQYFGSLYHETGLSPNRARISLSTPREGCRSIIGAAETTVQDRKLGSSMAVWKILLAVRDLIS